MLGSDAAAVGHQRRDAAVTYFKVQHLGKGTYLRTQTLGGLDVRIHQQERIDVGGVGLIPGGDHTVAPHGRFLFPGILRGEDPDNIIARGGAHFCGLLGGGYIFFGVKRLKGAGNGKFKGPVQFMLQQEQPQDAPLEQAAEQPDPDSVFSKLSPEQQQEMTDSVKAMLQTLIDADLKSTGEVSQGTKEAAQAQGFTIAGDGTLEQAEAPQEAAYRLESGDYLYIQTSETGYDYTLYGPDYKELDGGQLDNSDLTLAEAGKEILAIHELPAGAMEPLTGDRLDGFLEATEQANAISQPQAWNGIDGLLNGKPFMPEASPADRAAALIELAEKNAPRLGSEERQLIVAYAEAVGDTDKVIGLINRLCEQGYELQKGQMDSFVKSEIESEIAVANAQRQIAQNPAAEPVVTILWSESPHLKDGQQMPLHEAEAVFKELDSARRHEREQPGYWYDKTKFRIDFTMQGQPDSYEGRQDFGDGDGSLIQHIRGYHEYYAQDESWKNHVLHHEGPEAWEADKAQRDMLLHEFVPYMELHCNLAAMEQEARRPLRSGETLTPEQTAYFNAVLDYVKECRPLLNQGQYHLPEPPQLADFDQSLQDYKKQKMVAR